ncbi:hypothetical protein DQ392_07950 [Streptomyces reniochalinae]|uniref:Uncharacterized protein n=1 Tax=Streptomyces reniochalinae TaxID=2250578 RepID=A0A367EUE3_9ACTN|nr:hypothetical protein DQ392_07950 [Streptomyces reniochalinae]
MSQQAPLPLPHPVAAVLAERAAADSRPGARTDGYRVALAIEGGGMRGTVMVDQVQHVADQPHHCGGTDEGVVTGGAERTPSRAGVRVFEGAALMCPVGPWR